MNSTTLAIAVIVAVAALALLMRRGSGSDAATAPRPDTGTPEPAREAEDDEEDEEHEAEAGEEGDAEVAPALPVPVTAAGVAVVPAGTNVRLVALHVGDDLPDWLESGIAAGSVPSERVNEQLAVARRMGGGGEALHPGDFTGARVRRDAEGHWRVETLGREGEFGYMSFATETAARTALEMFEHAEVVRRPLDDDGHPVPASAEDFEEARRLFEETERELATATDDDEPAPPNDWSSRR